MNQLRQSAKLSAEQVRLLLALLVRNEAVFREFRRKIRVSHFREEHYRLVYRTVLDFHARYLQLPTEPELFAELKSLLEQDPDIISEAAQYDLDDFFEFAYSPATYGEEGVNSAALTRYAFQAAKRLLQQRQLEQFRLDLEAVDDLDVLTRLYSQAKVQADLLALADQGFGRTSTFEPEWDIRTYGDIRTTGLSFLDSYMNGGAKPTEAYGLMAPYGTCKTTLGVMLLCCGAKACLEQYLSNEDARMHAEDMRAAGNDVEIPKVRKGLSVLVTYEAPKKPEIQDRILMYSCQISRHRLEAMGKDGLAALSDDPASPLPYEEKLFAEQIRDGLFIPERSRIQRALPWLNEYTYVADMSGADPTRRSCGYGGIDEIVSSINSELRNRQQSGEEWYVHNVIIDYLGIMADQDSTRDKNMDDHKFYSLLAKNITRQISREMNCHAWVLHQLSGSANSGKTAASKLSHTDAKGSKSFAENLDFCFVIGNLNMESLGQLHCTKHRRDKPKPGSVIRVDGEFNTVVSPRDYFIDSTGKTVSRELGDVVGSRRPSVDSDEFARRTVSSSFSETEFGLAEDEFGAVGENNADADVDAVVAMSDEDDSLGGDTLP